MNDTPETQAAFLLFDTGEQGLHYVSEQMRKIERERDQNESDMARYLEAYQKQESENRHLEEKLAALKQTRSEPLRTAYSREELSEALNKWMIDLWGGNPKNLTPDEKDRYYRDNGLIYHFIADHFPTEKKEP